MADNHTQGSRGWRRRSFPRAAGIAAGVGFAGVPPVIESPGRTAASGHLTASDHVIESVDGTDTAATPYRPGTAGPQAALTVHAR